MCKSYRRVGRVYALTAVSRRTENIDTAILRIYLYFNFLCFRHDGHGSCGGVNPSAAFSYGHALYTMNSALVFEL